MPPGITDHHDGFGELGIFLPTGSQRRGSQGLLYRRYPDGEMLEIFIMCFWIVVDSMAWWGKQ